MKKLLLIPILLISLVSLAETHVIITYDRSSDYAYYKSNNFVRSLSKYESDTLQYLEICIDGECYQVKRDDKSNQIMLTNYQIKCDDGSNLIVLTDFYDNLLFESCELEEVLQYLKDL